MAEAGPGLHRKPHRCVGEPVRAPAFAQTAAHQFREFVRARPLLFNLMVAGIGIAAWEMAAHTGRTNPDWPAPSAITARVAMDLVHADPRPGDKNSERTLFRHVRITVKRWGKGFALALLIGLPIGIVLGTSKTTQAAGEQWVNLLRALPSAAIYPLAVLAFRLGPGSQLATIVYGATWPIVMNTASALQKLPPEFMDTLEFLHLEWWRRLSALVRRALPDIFVGVEMSAGVAFLLAVTVEIFYEADGGLGAYLSVQKSGTDQQPAVLGCIVVAAGLGWVLNQAIATIRQRLTPWAMLGRQSMPAQDSRSRSVRIDPAIDPQIDHAQRRILGSDNVTQVLEETYGSEVVVQVHFTGSPGYMLPSMVTRQYGRIKESEITQRDVTLSVAGAAGQQVVLFARSWVLSGRLSAEVRADLAAGKTTIGRILQQRNVKYSNRNVSYARFPSERLANVFGASGTIELIVRWRAILLKGRPAIVIQEFVPTQPIVRRLETVRAG